MLSKVGPILGALLLVIDFVFLPADPAVLPGGLYTFSTLEAGVCPLVLSGKNSVVNIFFFLLHTIGCPFIVQQDRKPELSYHVVRQNSHSCR